LFFARTAAYGGVAEIADSASFYDSPASRLPAKHLSP
jgi:hypothetical protein